ncbi:hypothetical protein [Tepidibacter mesophilus]|uniref:hypothetical protein n=1 Tax=Tepidibacter mesophilus TaxID=655607 RepID=UPI001650E8F0|nr:hypothetical protein [Tepidibacter mesophilus]
MNSGASLDESGVLVPSTVRFISCMFFIVAGRFERTAIFFAMDIASSISYKWHKKFFSMAE